MESLSADEKEKLSHDLLLRAQAVFEAATTTDAAGKTSTDDATLEAWRNGGWRKDFPAAGAFWDQKIADSTAVVAEIHREAERLLSTLHPQDDALVLRTLELGSVKVEETTTKLHVYFPDGGHITLDTRQSKCSFTPATIVVQTAGRRLLLLDLETKQMTTVQRLDGNGRPINDAICDHHEVDPVTGEVAWMTTSSGNAQQRVLTIYDPQTRTSRGYKIQGEKDPYLLTQEDRDEGWGLSGVFNIHNGEVFIYRYKTTNDGPCVDIARYSKTDKGELELQSRGDICNITCGDVQLNGRAHRLVLEGGVLSLEKMPCAPGEDTGEAIQIPEGFIVPSSHEICTWGEWVLIPTQVKGSMQKALIAVHQKTGEKKVLYGITHVRVIADTLFFRACDPTDAQASTGPFRTSSDMEALSKEFPSHGSSEMVKEANGMHWASGFVRSTVDESPVPYVIYRPASVDGPLPTMVEAYGGNNNTDFPLDYSAKGELAVRAGWAYLYVGVRGDFSLNGVPDWHAKGIGKGRLDGNEDLKAVVTHLQDRGLVGEGVFGGSSNGGTRALQLACDPRPRRTLARSAVTVATAPVVGASCIPALRTLYANGATWVGEFCGAREADQAAVGLATDPIKLLQKNGVRGPLVLRLSQVDQRTPAIGAIAWLLAAEARSPGKVTVLVDPTSGHGGDIVHEDPRHKYATAVATAVWAYAWAKTQEEKPVSQSFHAEVQGNTVGL